MFKIYSFISILLFSLSTASCSDSNSPNEEENTLSAPQVVSTTPAIGAAGVETGQVPLTVTYDQAVTLVRSKIYQVSISSGSLSEPTVSDKTLNITANCPDYETTVTIRLPEGLVTNSQGTAAPALQLTFTTKAASKPDPTSQDGHETAAQAVGNMAPGWNLGNTLDAWSASLGYGLATSRYETCWGQPVADAHLMKAVKDKGFNGVRIPVTWFQNMDESGNVRQEWMKRVEEVVNYVLDQGMYCILNVHHDTGAGSQAWLKADNTTYAAAQQRFQSLWTQIANHFKDHSDRLLFEGYNEMLAGTDTDAQWSEPKNTASYDAINKFAKLFVETVRATGGGNQYRNLIVTTYSASHTQKTLGALTIPTDPCGNQSHLAIEVHSYDPWNWVNVYNMTWTAACTKELQNMFADLNTYFITKGYSVIVGEYGTNGENEKTINASSSAAQKAEAGRQAGDMNRLCKKYGAASFYWMGLIEGKDRSEDTFKWTMEQVADSIVKVYK